MRASVAVDKVKELLRNSTSWSNRELASYVNRHIQSLTRKMVETDSGYFNYTFTLTAASARQKHTDLFEYTLPPWLMRITEIRDLSNTGTPSGVGLGAPIPFVSKFETLGLRFTGPNVLALKGYSIAKDFEVRCAKRPANLCVGTLPTQANLPAATSTSSFMRMDTDPAITTADWPHETLPNSYANSMVEITGVAARAGQLRRCIGSTHFQNEGGIYYTVLELEPTWTTQPQAADTYELHCEIPEEHMQLVILLAAHTAWGTRGQSDEQKAMAPLLTEQMAEFTAHIRPRQMAHPAYLRHSILPSQTGGLRTEDTRHTLWS